MQRYQELRQQEKLGIISDLECQVSYPMRINGVLVCTYRPDFRYTKDGRVVVEDVKGVKTRGYLIKKKLLRAVWGLEVLET